MRAFILGNSGELLDHDLSRLKGEAVFGVNALPLRCADIITHYVCMDIGMAFVPEVRALVPPTCKKYYSRLMWNTIYKEDNVNVFDCFPDNQPGFQLSDTRVHGGLTVSFVALQIAAYLGYDPIYILGVDLGTPANGIDHIPEQEEMLQMIRDKNLSNVTTDKRDTSGPTPGITPTVKLMQRNFLLARHELDKHGIEVYNLSKGGNLGAFKRMSFEEVLNSNHQTDIVSEVELSNKEVTHA